MRSVNNNNSFNGNRSNYWFIFPILLFGGGGYLYINGNSILSPESKTEITLPFGSEEKYTSDYWLKGDILKVFIDLKTRTRKQPSLQGEWVTQLSKNDKVVFLGKTTFIITAKINKNGDKVTERYVKVRSLKDGKEGYLFAGGVERVQSPEKREGNALKNSKTAPIFKGTKIRDVVVSPKNDNTKTKRHATMNSPNEGHIHSLNKFKATKRSKHQETVYFDADGDGVLKEATGYLYRLNIPLSNGKYAHAWVHQAKLNFLTDDPSTIQYSSKESNIVDSDYPLEEDKKRVVQQKKSGDGRVTNVQVGTNLSPQDPTFGELSKYGINGFVTFQFYTNEDGRVPKETIRIVETNIEDQDFKKAAIKCMQKFRFDKLKEGVWSEVTVTIYPPRS